MYVYHAEQDGTKDSMEDPYSDEGAVAALRRELADQLRRTLL